MGKKKELYYYNGKLKGEYLTEEHCIMLERLRRISDENGFIKDLKHVIYDLPLSDVEVIKVRKNSDDLVEKPLGTLSNVQTVGVAYMYYAKRLVLGDSVGMGKTVQVAGLFNLLESKYAQQSQPFNFIYLTEKNLVEETQTKVIKFTGNYAEQVYGDKKSVDKYISSSMNEDHFSIVGSHSLANSIAFQEYMRDYENEFANCPFDILVVDESAVLANQNTKIYENMMAIANRVEFVVLLNATSFEKSLKMYYNQLHFVDPTMLMPMYIFSEKFEVMSYYPYRHATGKYKNWEEFRDLVMYRYFARTRKSTGATMEGCTSEVILSDLSPQQKELLKLTSIPNMVYDCPGYFNMGIDTNTSTTPKLQSLVNLVEGRLADVNSILIYTRYKESQRAIYEALSSSDCVIMNGETPIEEKNNIINRFKTGKQRILITNVQKGLDFGCCNHCIFYSYDSNPNRMVQFEGRMTREYNIMDKHVYVLLSRGKELASFKNIAVNRGVASDLFAGSDFSCVMGLLLDEDFIKNLK